jgi:hypothetical protein
MPKSSNYARIMESIFHKRFKKGDIIIPFERDEIIDTASALGIRRPKNVGDVVYSFKYRKPLPASIQKTSPSEKEWVIASIGIAKYVFKAVSFAWVEPDKSLIVTKIPDATPNIISMYALSDEQALLTKLRYNRLIDIFTGVACYSLQNHLRTTISSVGQVETDELYVGIDKKGAHYVFPVQAKGGKDKIGVVQIEQDIVLCEEKFPDLQAKAIAAQFMANDVIALFEFRLEVIGQDDEGNDVREVRKVAEKHYKLVSPNALSSEELREYRNRIEVP